MMRSSACDEDITYSCSPNVGIGISAVVLGFLADRAVRKPSPHTAKAYRQDFAAIAALLADDRAQIAELRSAIITKEVMRAAFAAYADNHQLASIRWC